MQFKVRLEGTALCAVALAVMASGGCGSKPYARHNPGDYARSPSVGDELERVVSWARRDNRRGQWRRDAEARRGAVCIYLYTLAGDDAPVYRCRVAGMDAKEAIWIREPIEYADAPVGLVRYRIFAVPTTAEPLPRRTRVDLLDGPRVVGTYDVSLAPPVYDDLGRIPSYSNNWERCLYGPVQSKLPPGVRVRSPGFQYRAARVRGAMRGGLPQVMVLPRPDVEWIGRDKQDDDLLVVVGWVANTTVPSRPDLAVVSSDASVVPAQRPASVHWITVDDRSVQADVARSGAQQRASARR